MCENNLQRGYAKTECVTAATHIVTYFSGFLNGKYDLVIINIHESK